MLLALALPSSLHAGKKKDATPPPPASLADQRTEGILRHLQDRVAEPSGHSARLRSKTSSPAKKSIPAST